MGFAALEAMKSALLDSDVTALERIVLLDMAVALPDGSDVYAWGHDRLALALGKEPGTKAAERAMERTLSSLRGRGLVELLATGHRGRRAQYRLPALAENAPRPERGAMGTPGAENAPRFGTDSPPVSGPNAPRSERGATDISLPTTDIVRASFDALWSIWPKQTARAEAERSWSRAVRRESADVILQRAREYAADPSRPPERYVPRAADWLDSDRWNDPLPSAGSEGPDPSSWSWDNR